MEGEDRDVGCRDEVADEVGQGEGGVRETNLEVEREGEGTEGGSCVERRREGGQVESRKRKRAVKGATRTDRVR